MLSLSGLNSRISIIIDKTDKKREKEKVRRENSSLYETEKTKQVISISHIEAYIEPEFALVGIASALGALDYTAS